MNSVCTGSGGIYLLVIALIGVLITVVALMMTAANWVLKTGNALVWGLLTGLCFTATTGGVILLIDKPVSNSNPVSANLVEPSFAKGVPIVQSEEPARLVTKPEITETPQSVSQSQEDKLLAETNISQVLIDVLKALKSNQPISELDKSLLVKK